MDLALPGQLRGSECRRVVTQAVELRRILEPWFRALPNEPVARLTVVLRVDGSLGSFGPPGVENINLDGEALSCDLVVPDPGWETLSNREIREILREQIVNAIDVCLRHAGVLYEREELETLVGIGV
jgi:hypothetical protein